MTAMAGHKVSRKNLETMKYTSPGTGMSRETLEDFSITARNHLRESSEKGFASSKMTVSRKSIDSTSTSYNDSCPVLCLNEKQETLYSRLSYLREHGGILSIHLAGNEARKKDHQNPLEQSEGATG
jgi:hypothetical protein